MIPSKTSKSKVLPRENTRFQRSIISLKVIKMTSKWTPNGLQMDPKTYLWTQIGAIMTSLRSQCDLEMVSRNLEVASCNLTLLSWEPKVGSKPSRETPKQPRRTQKRPQGKEISSKSMKLGKACYGNPEPYVQASRFWQLQNHRISYISKWNTETSHTRQELFSKQKQIVKQTVEQYFPPKRKYWAAHRKEPHKTQQTHWAPQPQETLRGAAVSRQRSQQSYSERSPSECPQSAVVLPL